MKARPILFSGAMVRALLDGSKTQTRRVVKPQPVIIVGGGYQWDGKLAGFVGASGTHWDGFKRCAPWHCPYGQAGDLLWVRETIAYQWPDDCDNGRVYPDDEGADAREFGRPIKPAECDILYAATDLDAAWMGDNGEPCKPRWKPSIHMPRSASRITLEITSVRVELLQDISDADALSEGVIDPSAGTEYEAPADSDYKSGPRTWFAMLWSKINGIESWRANPWVWVVEFKVHQRHVDEILRERGAA